MRSGSTRADGRKSTIVEAEIASGNKSKTFAGWLKPNETPDEATAETVVAGLLSNAGAALQFSKNFGDVSLTECVAKLDAAVERVRSGDLRDGEAFLLAQTVTLNTIFTDLAYRAANAEYAANLDRFLRLALKAQAQCRATVEALAEMKNPKPVFVRQANFAHGDQQVNNGASESRVGSRAREERKIRSNRTIEK